MKIGNEEFAAHGLVAFPCAVDAKAGRSDLSNVWHRGRRQFSPLGLPPSNQFQCGPQPLHWHDKPVVSRHQQHRTSQRRLANP